MSGFLYRLGRFAARRPWIVIGSWLVVAVMVIGASGAFGRELEDSFGVPGTDSDEALELLLAAGADQAGLTAEVVVTPLDQQQSLLDPVAANSELNELAQLRSAIDNLPNVLATTDPAGMVSPDGRVALIQVQYPVLEELTSDDLDALKDVVADARAVDGSRLQIEMGGDLFFAFEQPGTGLGEMIGLVAAVVILLVAFGSLVAMGLPIGMALFGLAIGVSLYPLVSYVIEIPLWAPELATMVGAGVGIDYALFLVTRHREHLAQGMAVDESIGRAVATAGQAVLFAGGTVVVAILGLAVAGVPFITSGGVAISAVVAVMVVASLTILPAFLGLAGHRVNGFGLPFGRSRSRSRSHNGAVGGGWERWGRHVSAHPWRYAAGGTIFLLAMTAPVLNLRLGLPDAGTMPETRTERRAYDLVADGFGPGVNGPLVVAVDVSVDPSVVEPLTEAIGADTGIAEVAPAQVDTQAGVATIVAFPTTEPQAAATYKTIERLRADVIPDVLDATGSPATAHIGGETATLGDVADRVANRMPVLIGAVVVMSLLLLTVVFRSVLVAVKAAVLNLLSIGAAYGVLVMVFQWGWGGSLIGLEGAVPIVSMIPLFMFAILFGLSMDYEVFLLSRVREHYLATGDNDSAVVQGISSTARVIGSAALIMVSVFSGFVLSNDPTIKMFGIGLATAIAVDATIVRLMLVPATMKLLGDANWWLPDWLDRLLPTIDLDNAGPDAELEAMLNDEILTPELVSPEIVSQR